MEPKKTFTYLMLIICGLVMVIPFVWMLTTAVKSQLEINKGNIGFLPLETETVYEDSKIRYRAKVIMEEADSCYVHLFDEEGKIIRKYQGITTASGKVVDEYMKVPQSAIKDITKIALHFENFVTAFNKVPFARYFLNTIIVSFSVVIGVVITGALAAYAFARMRFVGREFIFYFFISMMMVPQPVYLIPSYILLNYLGMIDTYYALIFPWITNIFTIFLLRQQFKTVPQELFDAAAIDGCSRFGILWKIVLPLSKSVLATAAIFGFIGSWNSFMWPLVMTDSPALRVLQVGLSYFSQEASSQTALLMAASTFSILPLLILFLFAQRQIISSFASSGLKG
ncbi:MAG TPA: ribokinase [Candidatus Cloacimonas sp.]|jgi:ABC-type glycerol-3-phosphate transport system permease component|nr:multiple sugar transport system permease protein [Candidatus Cloacimonadota bacterium]HCX73890.1 ribokinase [Candidatus Cloacimonas sp.]